MVDDKAGGAAERALEHSGVRAEPAEVEVRES